MPSSVDEVISGPKQKILQELFDSGPDDLLESRAPCGKEGTDVEKEEEDESFEAEEETSMKSISKKERDNRMNCDTRRNFTSPGEPKLRECHENFERGEDVEVEIREELGKKMYHSDERERRLMSECVDFYQKIKTIISDSGESMDCQLNKIFPTVMQNTMQHSTHSYLDNKDCENDKHATSAKVLAYEDESISCNESLKPTREGKFTCEERNRKIVMENQQLKFSSFRLSQDEDMINTLHQYEKMDLEKGDHDDKFESLKRYADNKVTYMEKLPEIMESVTRVENKENEVDIEMTVESTEKRLMKIDKESANKAKKADLYHTDEKHEHEEVEKSCEEHGLSEVDTLDALGWQEVFLKESLCQASLIEEKIEPLASQFSMYSSAKDMESYMHSLRSPPGFVSTYHSFQAENMLSLEFMIARNFCYQGNIILSDFSNGCENLYGNGWQRPNEFKIINKSLYSRCPSLCSLRTNVFTESSLTKKCKSKSFCDMLEMHESYSDSFNFINGSGMDIESMESSEERCSESFSLSTEMPGEMGMEMHEGYPEHFSFITGSTIDSNTELMESPDERWDERSSISIDCGACNDEEPKECQSGDDSGFGNGSHCSTHDSMDEVEEQLDNSLFSMSEPLSVYLEDEKLDGQDQAGRQTGDLQGDETGKEASWAQHDEGVCMEGDEGDFEQEDKEDWALGDEDVHMHRVEKGQGGEMTPSDLQQDPVKILSPHKDIPGSRIQYDSDEGEDGSKDEQRKSMRDHENKMMPKYEKKTKHSCHQRSALKLPQQSQDERGSKRDRCYRQKGKDDKQGLHSYPSKGLERKGLSHRKSKNCKRDRNDRLEGRHRPNICASGKKNRTHTKDARQAQQRKCPWRENKSWWRRRLQQTDAWTRRRRMPVHLKGHERGFSAKHSCDPPIQLSSVKSRVRQHSGGEAGGQRQNQGGSSQRSNGSVGGSQGNPGKGSGNGGKNNSSGRSGDGDGDGNRKRNGQGNSNKNSNTSNNLDHNNVDKSSNKVKSIKFDAKEEANAVNKSKTQFKSSAPSSTTSTMTHVSPPHNLPPDKVPHVSPHHGQQLSARGPPSRPSPVVEPSLPPPALDDETIARRLQVEENRAQEGSATPESAYATPTTSYSPPGSSYHTSESAVPLNDLEGSQAAGGGQGSEQAVLQPVISDGSQEDLDLPHAVITIEQLCHTLGDATYDLPNDNEGFRSLNMCMTHIMHDLAFCTTVEDTNEATARSWSVSECTVCLVLSQLMNHLANLDHEGFVCGCNQCSQIFNIMKQHSIICIREGRPRSRLSRSDLCNKICKASDWRVDQLTSISSRLNGKLRKYCAKVLGNVLETPPKGKVDDGTGQVMAEMGIVQTTEILSTGLSSGNSKQSGHSLSVCGNIVTTETGDQEAAPCKETPHPFVPVSQSGHLPAHLAHATPSSQSKYPAAPLHAAHALPAVSSSANVSDRVMAVMPPASTMAGAVGGNGDDLHSQKKLGRKPSIRKQPAIPTPIVEENQAIEHSSSAANLQGATAQDEIKAIFDKRYGDDKYDTQKTYGGSSKGFESVPLGVNFHDEEQFMSVWTRPRGVPGVGEVVFGHPSQLRKIAGFWDKKREECERTQTCPYMHREEGVILAEQKENFNILRTRYQKHQQWERVTHLGNGMSGKCHLAIDLKSDFKFCCKKIHLLKYAEEELSLWSEMHNPYIVRLYGAIRHGYKVYIFSEFLDGGSLQACIEEQKRLGRRLSHWSAINYFHQMLKVLAYLQSKNILHEDIKADNILLRRNSTHLAVTDFGTSRRLQDPKELKNKSPLGSPTHWSPEKASMEGHGFPSDLWAAVCVLVHMLSGEPPWVKRYLQKATILNFIIYAKPPPMEDVPDNVQTVVRDLIEKGFVKDPQHRPSPSELLRHPAFSMLDEGTPESYYSTLLSQAQAVMAGVHIAGNAIENQNQRTEAAANILPSVQPETTVLFETAVSTGPYQESDHRPENRENQQHARRPSVGESQQNTEQGLGAGRNDGQDSQEEEEMKKGESDYSHESEDQGRNEMRNDEGTAHAGNLSKEKKEEGSIPNDGKENIPEKINNSTSNLRVATPASVSVDNTGESQTSLSSSGRSRLLEPVDINNLLPVFDELFPSGDSENQQSIKSFFADDYSKSTNLCAAAQVPLQEYKPEIKSGEQVPNLSIFGAGWGEPSQILSQPGESSSSSNNTLTHPGENLIRNQPLPGPSAGTQNPSGTLRKFKETHLTSAVNFYTSSESDECTSADIFDSGPNEASEAARQSSSQQDATKRKEMQGGCDVIDAKASPNATPLSPSDLSPVASTGSNHSSGVSSLQSRKPINLKLNVSGTPAPHGGRLSQSQNDIQAVASASSTGTTLGEQHKRHTWSNMQHPSSQYGVTPRTGSTPSTGRKHSGASGPNTGSSGSFFRYDVTRPNSVKEEQDKCFQELQADMISAVSHTSSGSDRLSDLIELPQENQKEEESVDLDEKDSDSQAAIAALQGEIKELDESQIGGHKLHFHQPNGETFVLRVHDWPVYWKFIIRRVRQRIMQGGLKHFAMLHMDNSCVKFDRQLKAQEFKVHQYSEQRQDCWCERCQTMY